MNRDDYKGHVTSNDLVRREQAWMEAHLPEDSRVIHTGGRVGTVKRDHARSVPGWFTGTPTAWCVMDLRTRAAAVCVRWDNPAGIPWIAWVPFESLRPARASRTNKPALATKAGA